MARLDVVLYHDVLCSWCYLADRRLAVLRAQYAGALRFGYRAYAIRPEAEAPSSRDLRLHARHYRRAAREPDGGGIVPDLWLGADAPNSTLPPLVALEAARLQGASKRDALLEALREAAFRRGLNVTRRDVLIEIAERVGLSTDLFITALDAPATEQAVRAEHAEAVGRGVRGVPALAFRSPGGDTLITGARSLDEYRDLFEKQLGGAGEPPRERLLH